jgi:hypothetical protein
VFWQTDPRLVELIETSGGVISGGQAVVSVMVAVVGSLAELPWTSITVSVTV